MESGSARVVVLEVCIASEEDAVSAESGGADRLELNTALELGGLSPSRGLLESVLQATALPVIAMCRPRAAGFVYSDRERLTLLRDVEAALEAGAAGVALGGLTGERTIDEGLVREARRLVGQGELVFHRAFDLVSDPVSGARELKSLGVDRLLTSGTAPTALAGAACLRELVGVCEPGLRILAGAGVRPGNVAELVSATGVVEVHGSFSRTEFDEGGVVSAGEFPRTSRELVAETRRVLDSIDLESARGV